MATPTKRNPLSPYTAKRLDGLFKDNEWYCNCATRERAVRLQVKKDNQNRGRWFYKCAKPQPQQCQFFLWQENAAIRERDVLMANSTSETDPRTQTPSKSNASGLLTPQTERRYIDIPPRTSVNTKPSSTPLSAKARMMAEDTDEFNWDLDSEDNAEITEVLSQSQRAQESFISQPDFGTSPKTPNKAQRAQDSFISQPDFEHSPSTPNKTPRTPKTPSPGKRKLSEYAYDQSHSTSGSSILATPNSSHSLSFSSRIPPASAEVCMTPTPTKYRDGDVLSADSRSDALESAQNLLSILDKHDVVIPNAARDAVVSWVNREDKKFKGAVRARDMLRGAVKQKDQEILKLKEKVTNLRAQMELDHSMINSFDS